MALSSWQIDGINGTDYLQGVPLTTNGIAPASSVTSGSPAVTTYYGIMDTITTDGSYKPKVKYGLQAATPVMAVKYPSLSPLSIISAKDIGKIDNCWSIAPQTISATATIYQMPSQYVTGSYGWAYLDADGTVLSAISSLAWPNNSSAPNIGAQPAATTGHATQVYTPGYAGLVKTYMDTSAQLITPKYWVYKTAAITSKTNFYMTFDCSVSGSETGDSDLVLLFGLKSVNASYNRSAYTSDSILKIYISSGIDINGCIATTVGASVINSTTPETPQYSFRTLAGDSAIPDPYTLQGADPYTYIVPADPYGVVQGKLYVGATVTESLGFDQTKSRMERGIKSFIIKKEGTNLLIKQKINDTTQNLLMNLSLQEIISDGYFAFGTYGTSAFTPILLDNLSISNFTT